MGQKAGARISQRAFIQSLVILFILMIAGCESHQEFDLSRADALAGCLLAGTAPSP